MHVLAAIIAEKCGSLITPTTTSVSVAFGIVWITDELCPKQTIYGLPKRVLHEQFDPFKPYSRSWMPAEEKVSPVNHQTPLEMQAWWTRGR